MTYGETMRGIKAKHPKAHAVRWDANTVLVYKDDTEMEHIATVSRKRNWQDCKLTTHPREG